MEAIETQQRVTSHELECHASTCRDRASKHHGTRYPARACGTTLSTLHLWAFFLVMLVCTNVVFFSEKGDCGVGETAQIRLMEKNSSPVAQGTQGDNKPTASKQAHPVTARPSMSVSARSRQMVMTRNRSALSSPQNENYSAPVWPSKIQNATRVRICSPRLIDLNSASYSSTDEFYAALMRRPTHKPPMIHEKHEHLCNETSDRERVKGGWKYCLPISGELWNSSCSGARRTDLLTSVSDGTTYCQASVLHMLLLDVYTELETHGAHPAILFGTLLGAVRNGSIIPYTEDVDIGYRVVGDRDLTTEVRQALWKKGYHMFYNGIHRVCVAPTHPLARVLYDATSTKRLTAHTMPYVDLYLMTARNGSWTIQKMRKQNLTQDHVEPFSVVSLNGRDFNTIANPTYFLEQEYGRGWRVPRPRGHL